VKESPPEKIQGGKRKFLFPGRLKRKTQKMIWRGGDGWWDTDSQKKSLFKKRLKNALVGKKNVAAPRRGKRKNQKEARAPKQSGEEKKPIREKGKDSLCRKKPFKTRRHKEKPNDRSKRKQPPAKKKTLDAKRTGGRGGCQKKKKRGLFRRRENFKKGATWG